MTNHTRPTGVLCIRMIAAFLAVFVFMPNPAHAAIPSGERQVLISLYNATHGGGWKSNANWCSGACPVSGTSTFNTSGTECNWYGIECDDANTHVIAIGLSYNNLSGTLPSLSALASLQSVAIAANQLTGSIPPLGSLAQLQTFYADDNRFSGSIANLAGLSRLGDFSVRHNQLTGSIPSLSGLTNLYSFGAAGNQLTGTIPSLTGLSALREFDVGDNQLTGGIPSLAGLGNLVRLSVNRNRLTGAIPDVSGLPALHNLNAGFNQLTGPVPAAPASLYTPLAFSLSKLCPNPLSTSPSANDAGWNAATGFTSWWATPYPSNRCDDLFVGKFDS
jgi:hypothetical protein